MRGSEAHKDKTDVQLIDYLDHLIIEKGTLTDRGALYELVRRYEVAIKRKLT